jgi:hypothetical protein
LGLDVDLRQVVVGMQCERGRIGPARKFSREQLDGRELCVRLSRYLDGHGEELKPIRIPSRSERQRRGWAGSVNFGKKSCGGWKTTAGRSASSMSTRL